jgi:hypothetical protein
MIKTFEETEKTRLTKKYHTLLGKAGVSEDEKMAMLGSYGVASSKEMSVEQLIDLCNNLTNMANPELAKLDKLRKRAIASIFGYYKAKNEDVTMNYVKGTAAQAAGYRSFNDIPAERLRNLYYLFNDKAKDVKAVSASRWEIRVELINYN